MVERNNSQDLLSIIEHLVDNIQDTNSANTEVLKSVNLTLTKISETVPEIRTVSEKVSVLNTESIISEVRTISTNLKVFVAILSIVISLGMVIFGLYQTKLEYNIIEGVSTKIEKQLLYHKKNSGI